MALAPAITELIDKQDTFEVVRDQLAAILKVEAANQAVLATAAGEDPTLWDLRVFSERSNPWEEFRDDVDAPPIVNVWYDGSSFDPSSSNKIECQKTLGLFNVDCYARGVAQSDGTGQKAGDEEAALAAHRTLRLVRNILMAAHYTYLGMRGVVWGRWPLSVKVFQPQQNNENTVQVVGARIVLEVTFNELSPQIPLEVLELLTIAVTRAENGEVLLNADYEYPIT